MGDNTIRLNFGRNRDDDLTRLVEDAIRRRIFPGIEVLVAKGDQVLLHESWGRLEIGPDSPELARGTLWDLASVTKPVATATCLLVLLEKGLLSLEDRVAHLLSEFDSPQKSSITLRHLLTHTSGLPHWSDLYSETTSQAEALQRLAHITLANPTGAAMVYSDLGYLLLGEVIRRVSGQSLSEFFHQQVAHPLQLQHTAFSPLARGWELPIAPTQYCPFRQQLLRGIVHDENSFRFGGEGGNAGLFATATDLHRFARMMLHHGELDGVRILSARTVALMAANHNPRRLPARGLGWDIKGEGQGYTSCGDLMQPGAIGHTGFTGTSLWIEPTGGLTVIVLSNRVHISREKNQADMIRFRPRLHNVIVGMMGE